jgi:hypothetical protein
MGALMGGGGGEQKAMMQQQMAMQAAQQVKVDAQERDQKAALLARQRAAQFGGSRSLISAASLGGGQNPASPASGMSPALGSNG